MMIIFQRNQKVVKSNLKDDRNFLARNPQHCEKDDNYEDCPVKHFILMD